MNDNKQKWLEIIRSSIGEFDDFLKNNRWFGRENEVVNLFAHRFLAKAISPSGPLRSMRQVGIEVAVTQVCKSTQDKKRKKLVRKDLVIWPEEDMTVWTADGTHDIKNTPAVIIEWKTNNKDACRNDIEWLRLYCSKYPQTIGFAICTHVKGAARGCETCWDSLL